MSNPTRIIVPLVAATAMVSVATQLPSPFHIAAAIAALCACALAVWRLVARPRPSATEPPRVSLREVGRRLEKCGDLAVWLRSELAATRFEYDRTVRSISAANGADPDLGAVGELRRSFMAACNEVEAWLTEADMLAAEVRRHIARHADELDEETPARLAIVFSNAFSRYKRALIEVQELRGYLC